MSSYESLLREMKIALMSEDNSFDVIDKIGEVLESLKIEDADTNDSTDTEEMPEEEYSTFEDPNSKISSKPVLTPSQENAEGQQAYSQEDNLTFNVQEYTEESSSVDSNNKSFWDNDNNVKDDIDFFIEQVKDRNCIFNRHNEKIYSSNGRLKMVGNKPYRVYLTYSHITINSLDRYSDGTFTTGERIIDAKSNTSFYKAFNDYDRIDLIQKIDTIYNDGADEILFDGTWYYSDGEIDTSRPQDNNVIDSESDTSSIEEDKQSINLDSHSDVYVLPEKKKLDKEDSILETYKPKGKLSKIKDYTNSPYDYLWLMSIVDYMGEDNPQSSISMDKLAIHMIANAWETVSIYPGTIDKLPDVKKCIEFYISESKSYMDKPLDWNSPKELILSEIKDYPVGDEVEDVMDKLVSTAPYRVDNTWIKTDNMMDLVEMSKEFYGRCLYGIHLRKHDSFIQINPWWIWNLHKERDQLIRYYRALYRNSLMDKS